MCINRASYQRCLIYTSSITQIAISGLTTLPEGLVLAHDCSHQPLPLGHLSVVAHNVPKTDFLQPRAVLLHSLQPPPSIILSEKRCTHTSSPPCPISPPSASPFKLCPVEFLSVFCLFVLNNTIIQLDLIDLTYLDLYPTTR